jgi:hypothetical protein
VLDLFHSALEVYDEHNNHIGEMSLSGEIDSTKGGKHTLV